MKTKPYKHQSKYMKLSKGKESFALFCEQGTGKSWMVLADSERLYGAGTIDAILIVAPRGVHINWIKREIPKHLEAPHLAAWFSVHMTKKHKRVLDDVYKARHDGEVPPLRIIAINYEALLTKRGFDLAASFVRSTKCLMIVDESQKIKNHRAARTLRCGRVGIHAAIKRIATGTPITQSPGDLFAQFEFLDSTILETSSYRAFVAEYADVLPPDHGLMRHIAMRLSIRAGWGSDLDKLSSHQKDHLARKLPLMVAKDKDDMPIWRNIDKLQRLIEPYSYRVTKKECLDLPEKVYKNIYFELDDAQMARYELAAKELRIQLGDEVLIMKEMNAVNKLQQITSGFILLRGEAILIAPERNPRMDAFLSIVEDLEGKFIVWAKYREELRQIAAMLKRKKIAAVEYHGGVKVKDRETAVDSFQEGGAQAFVGQPQAGGVGLTLTAARTVIYYSNDFNLETRLQSEDRAHRIGTTTNVNYIDLVAVDTIDERIAEVLQQKSDTASTILDGAPATKLSLPSERRVRA